MKRKYFPPHYTGKKCKIANITGHFWFLILMPLSRLHCCREAPFSNVFCPNENEKLAFSNSSGMKSVFEKLRFRDGLVWTVDLTVEIKLCFQISATSLSSCQIVHKESFSCIYLLPKFSEKTKTTFCQIKESREIAATSLITYLRVLCKYKFFSWHYIHSAIQGGNKNLDFGFCLNN